ncbi:HAMP domain-containing histidine kinase [Oerskovia turbata]|uniref:histidine kinase n=2 Tax=Oerskovia turbata TaxID=1713 RepID=A0A4Q1L3B7_9CELL|nr:HAMP domain-containing histidine kinase [Oerskovia turbata]RXR36292.1 HAMP domain-containing histidine kinase [Oerskovia turbata]TGJ94752.1 sensor histidine kinase [Actinotalea fermentans ATCC 43279 = JCM 9966 = DSM 3133]TGJ94767.1 sensor histidine kinase [Actinotalea fermentans ATCC 43279 = JCM 9966 = DSM 3133]
MLLLAAGLGVAAVATSVFVSNYLVRQVDDQLKATSVDVATDPTSQFSQNTAGLPSDYYILYRWSSGFTRAYYFPSTPLRYGLPDIPALSLDEVRRIDGPFTVPPQQAGVLAPTDPTQWRVMPLVDPDGSTAFVALPLSGIHDTVRFLGWTLAISALAISLVGGAIAFVAVQRALRPLREIEEAAADIAGGDLTRRIRPAPPTTEVGSLAASLNIMLNHIERAFAASEASEARMRRFVSDASHELRTPLATVRGYGELYRMGALTTPEQMDDTMRRIEDSASRMGTLVNDLLALARLDEGRPIRHEPVNLAALARDSAGDLHALDPTREVRLVRLDDAPGDAPRDLTVIGDEDRLRQVLANLIGNVSQHTPAGTPVEIALGTQVSAGDVPVGVLEVRDHGPGITPEQADHVFERFYRADSSRNRASGGSGLGMAIVAAIVGAHHGHISVAPTQGGGLTVRVELPTQGYDGGSSTDRT